MSNITLVLESVGRGESQATEELFPLVYEELRRLAAARMARRRRDTRCSRRRWCMRRGCNWWATGDRTWKNRAHFFGAAAEAMRRILIDNARRKSALKHGGGQEPRGHGGSGNHRGDAG